MHTRTITVIAAVLWLSAITYLSFQYFYQPKKSTLAPSSPQNSSSVSTTIQYEASSSGYTLTSDVFDFRFNLPRSVNYSPESVTATGELIKIVFREPNSNTSEKVNRQTPNGFNTSADNSFRLTLYENTEFLTAASGSALTFWIVSNGLGSVTDATKTFTAGNFDVVRHVQSDGIDSHGYYYYFFSSKYIYILGTDDLTHDQMVTYLSSFNLFN